MTSLFKDCISLVDNTNEISKKCNVSLKTKGKREREKRRREKERREREKRKREERGMDHLYRKMVQLMMLVYWICFI